MVEIKITHTENGFTAISSETGAFYEVNYPAFYRSIRAETDQNGGTYIRADAGKDGVHCKIIQIRKSRYTLHKNHKIILTEKGMKIETDAVDKTATNLFFYDHELSESEFVIKYLENKTTGRITIEDFEQIAQNILKISQLFKA